MNLTITLELSNENETRNLTTATNIGDNLHDAEINANYLARQIVSELFRRIREGCQDNCFIE